MSNDRGWLQERARITQQIGLWLVAALERNPAVEKHIEANSTLSIHPGEEESGSKVYIVMGSWGKALNPQEQFPAFGSREAVFLFTHVVITESNSVAELQKLLAKRKADQGGPVIVVDERLEPKS